MGIDARRSRCDKQDLALERGPVSSGETSSCSAGRLRAGLPALQCAADMARADFGPAPPVRSSYCPC